MSRSCSKNKKDSSFAVVYKWKNLLDFQCGLRFFLRSSRPFFLSWKETRFPAHIELCFYSILMVCFASLNDWWCLAESWSFMLCFMWVRQVCLISDTAVIYTLKRADRGVFNACLRIQTFGVNADCNMNLQKPVYTPFRFTTVLTCGDFLIFLVLLSNEKCQIPFIVFTDNKNLALRLVMIY